MIFFIIISLLHLFFLTPILYYLWMFTFIYMKTINLSIFFILPIFSILLNILIFYLNNLILILLVVLLNFLLIGIVLITLNIEFIFLLFIIIYIGALMILFLFILMLSNIKNQKNLKEWYFNYLIFFNLIFASLPFYYYNLHNQFLNYPNCIDFATIWQLTNQTLNGAFALTGLFIINTNFFSLMIIIYILILTIFATTIIVTNISFKNPKLTFKFFPILIFFNINYLINTSEINYWLSLNTTINLIQNLMEIWFFFSIFGIIFYKRNLLITMLFIEIAYISIFILFICTSIVHNQPIFQQYALLLLITIACESAIGLGLILNLSKKNLMAEYSFLTSLK